MRPQPLSNDFITSSCCYCRQLRPSWPMFFSKRCGDNDDDFLMITIIIIVTNVKCRRHLSLKHRLLINLNNLVGKKLT